MITIVNGTNRSGNLSQIISKYYRDELVNLGAKDTKYISMEDLSEDIAHSLMFTPDGRCSSLTTIQDDIIIPSDKLFFIIPEYNGGMPGILKLFIDACSIHRLGENFMGKKVGMLGVAAGRAGNLRGMEHLTGIMNYLGATVMPNRLPISVINSLIDKDLNKLTDENTKCELKAHAKLFLEF